MSEEKREETMQTEGIEDVRPTLYKTDIILSLCAILLSGCVLAGAIPGIWIGLAIAALVAYTIVAVKNAGAVIQLILTALAATVATAFSPIAAASVLALMLGAGTLAWLFMTLPKCKWAPVTLLAVAYGLGFLVTSNPVTPLLSFAFLPVALLLAWAHARDIGRTNTVLHAVLGFIITFLAVLCVILWRAYGSINYDILLRFISDIKQLFVTIGIEAGKMLWESMEAVSLQANLPADSMEQIRQAYAVAFSESNLRVLADTVVGLTPALVIVPAMIISYLSDVVLLRKYYNTEWRSLMTPAACTLTVSPAAGVMYFVCFILDLFVTRQTVFTMAISNMHFILMPALCLTGVNVLLNNARRARGWMGVATILLLISAVCCMGTTSFYFAALWGAYATVTAALHQKIMQKIKDQNEDQY